MLSIGPTLSSNKKGTLFLNPCSCSVMPSASSPKGVHPLRSLVTSVLFWGPNWPRTEVTEDRSGWVTSVPRIELHIRRTDLHLVILHAKCFEIDDSGKRGHSQKHYKRRSRLDDRKFVFANRVVNKLCYLRFVLIVPSVLRHWLWRDSMWLAMRIHGSCWLTVAHGPSVRRSRDIVLSRSTLLSVHYWKRRVLLSLTINDTWYQKWLGVSSRQNNVNDKQKGPQDTTLRYTTNDIMPRRIYSINHNFEPPFDGGDN